MEVAAAFKSQGFEFGEGDDVAKECLAMCHHFQASPEDVATSWDSYYTVNQAKMKTHVPTAAHMEAFRAHFERHVASAKKSNAVKTPQAYVYGKRSLAESLESGALDVEMADAAVDASLAAVTPGRKGDTPGAKTAGALLAGYFLGVQGFAQVVKAATARVRPDQIHHATFSFPSLHTATAVYMAGALLCVLAPALLAGDDDPSEGPPWRWTPAAAGGVASLGAATAAGRVLTESHWLSDTVAGAALGVAALAAAVALANDADVR